VINGVIRCHVSLRVQVDAAGRYTPPLQCSNQYTLAARSHLSPLAPWIPPGESC
jgi:hypothetical protein